jgi:hypothetical protein
MVLAPHTSHLAPHNSMKLMKLPGNLKVNNMHDQSEPKYASEMFDKFIANRRADGKINSMVLKESW